MACLPVGQALVWQEKFAKSLQTTFALSSLAIHFTASPWRGGLLLGAWCLVEVLLPDYQTSLVQVLERQHDKGDSRGAESDACPNQLVIARAAVARLLPTNWILEDHSSCAAGVEWGSDILVHIVTAWPPSCQIAHAMPQLLRRARTWRWLSAVIILAESCLCGRWI